MLLRLQYDLTVVASDSLNEIETTVVVYVRDLNDLPPEFDQASYVVNITEETVFVDAPLNQVAFEFEFACHAWKYTYVYAANETNSI